MSKVVTLQNSEALKSDLKLIKKLTYEGNDLKEAPSWDDLSEKRNKSEESHEFFQLHPKKLLSDTETSMSYPNSPKFMNFSSSMENVEEQPHEEYNIQESSRRKLLSKITSFNSNYLCEMDIGVEEGCATSPTTAVKDTATNTSKKNIISESKTHKLAVVSIVHPKREVKSGAEFLNKFKTVAERCLKVLKDIRQLFETGISPPDGDEDTNRRLVRVKEFTSRYSRNYLYPLARQLEQLDSLEKYTLERVFQQKLISAYQMVFHGLQTFYHHLPSTIGNTSVDKFKVLLNYLERLCNTHELLVKLPKEQIVLDFVRDFKENSDQVLQHITSHNFNATSSNTLTKPSTAKVVPSKAKFTLGSKSSKMDTRFSMYSVTSSFRRDKNWKKVVEAFSKKKYNVKSRYKTGTFRHRPPPIIEDLNQNAELSKGHLQVTKLLPKKSKSLEPVNPPPTANDDIPTMIQMENEKDDDVKWEDKLNELKESSKQMIHEDLAIKLHELVRTTTEQHAAAKGGDLECLNVLKNPQSVNELVGECLKNDEGKEALVSLFQELDRKSQTMTTVVVGEEQDGRKVEEKAAVGKKSRKEPIITKVTGVKNAKLICIKDENSICYSDEDDTSPNAVIPLKDFTTSQTQTLKTGEQKDRCTQKSVKKVKISRLAKNLRNLRMLPKDYAVNIIQYKLDFKTHCKENPMYLKTDNLLPWMLMGKLSDEILNCILLDVAHEIELNDVIDRLYQEELQL